MGIPINARVQIRAGLYGVIRYVGPVDGKEGIWAGMELDSARGTNDGSHQGRRYFVCNKNYGLFLNANRLTSTEDNGEDTEYRVVKKDRTKDSFLKNEASAVFDSSRMFSFDNMDSELLLAFQSKKENTRPNSTNVEFLSTLEPNKTYNFIRDNSALENNGNAVDGNKEHGNKQHGNKENGIGDAASLLVLNEKIELFRKESAVLEEQNSELKKLFLRLAKLSYEKLTVMKASLEKIASQLAKLKKIPVSLEEKNRVAGLVQQICAGKSEYIERTTIEEFVEIMNKYNINVEITNI
ncbi:hypothetical protein ENBRE01_1308 [Enteropsectra breve]|nr:hypothetical protein ENBRE01_1308 [Enteropsectra breve]